MFRVSVISIWLMHAFHSWNLLSWTLNLWYILTFILIFQILPMKRPNSNIHIFRYMRNTKFAYCWRPERLFNRLFSSRHFSYQFIVMLDLARAREFHFKFILNLNCVKSQDELFHIKVVTSCVTNFFHVLLFRWLHSETRVSLNLFKESYSITDDAALVGKSDTWNSQKPSLVSTVAMLYFYLLILYFFSFLISVTAYLYAYSTLLFRAAWPRIMIGNAFSSFPPSSFSFSLA